MPGSRQTSNSRMYHPQPYPHSLRLAPQLLPPFLPQRMLPSEAPIAGGPLPRVLVPAPPTFTKTSRAQLPPQCPPTGSLSSPCNHAVISLCLKQKTTNKNASLGPTPPPVTILFLCSLYSQKSPKELVCSLFTLLPPSPVSPPHDTLIPINPWKLLVSSDLSVAKSIVLFSGFFYHVKPGYAFCPGLAWLSSSLATPVSFSACPLLLASKHRRPQGCPWTTSCIH